FSLTFISISRVINFVSWNVKGLGRPSKLNKVITHLDSLQAKIVFLQETHLNVSDHTKLRRRWVSQSFHSLFSSRARGVAILIHKDISFKPSDVQADRYGRYIIVSGLLFNTPVVLANVYAPNFDDDNFFIKFLSVLPNLHSSYLIIGGDFNLCLNPQLDRVSQRGTTLSKSAKIINYFLNDYAVTDVWRFLNPSTHGYSFFSHVHQSFSRIDYFLIDNKLLPWVQHCTCNAIVISDHSPLTLGLRFECRCTQRPLWRLNVRLLTIEDFVQTIS
uniref:exodeoxyribonuclease III n=1 Tax=Sinocyclocheilus rhinocerous TaxID=307959 RepID=A0A673GPH0_9TELE